MYMYLYLYINNRYCPNLKQKITLLTLFICKRIPFSLKQNFTNSKSILISTIKLIKPRIIFLNHNMLNNNYSK